MTCGVCVCACTVRVPSTMRVYVDIHVCVMLYTCGIVRITMHFDTGGLLFFVWCSFSRVRHRRLPPTSLANFANFANCAGARGLRVVWSVG